MPAALLERIAHHEAGHACACIVYGVPLISVTVVDRPLVRRGRLRGGLGVEIVGTICFAGPAAEELFCGLAAPADRGNRIDYEMAYAHLQRHVGPLRRGLEFERARDSARALVRTSWAQRVIPVLAEALQRYGTLDGDQVSDVLLGDPLTAWSGRRHGDAGGDLLRVGRGLTAADIKRTPGSLRTRGPLSS
jgi:hypothetical protein